MDGSTAIRMTMFTAANNCIRLDGAVWCPAGGTSQRCWIDGHGCVVFPGKKGSSFIANTNSSVQKIVSAPLDL